MASLDCLLCCRLCRPAWQAQGTSSLTALAAPAALKVALAVQREAGSMEAVVVSFPGMEPALGQLIQACAPATFGKGSEEGGQMGEGAYSTAADKPTAWHACSYHAWS